MSKAKPKPKEEPVVEEPTVEVAEVETLDSEDQSRELEGEFVDTEPEPPSIGVNVGLLVTNLRGHFEGRGTDVVQETVNRYLDYLEAHAND